MRAILGLIVCSLLAPLAAAGAEAQCQATDAGVVCVGDYEWQEGDHCESDSLHEHGTGVWAETVVGDASASGFRYCNVYGGYGYWEEGVRTRIDTEPVFLEVSWNKWSFEEFEGPNDLSGCSTWVYYIGPIYGYYNNVGCPAGDPPAQPWGDLWP